MKASKDTAIARFTGHLRHEPNWTVLERLEYLLPTRYFRFYLFSDRRSNVTCWLPEGFSR